MINNVDKFTNKEVAKIMLSDGKFEDYRLDGNMMFIGILFRVNYDDRNQVKEVLNEALESYVK